MSEELQPPQSQRHPRRRINQNNIINVRHVISAAACVVASTTSSTAASTTTILPRGGEGGRMCARNVVSSSSSSSCMPYCMRVRGGDDDDAVPPNKSSSSGTGDATPKKKGKKKSKKTTTEHTHTTEKTRKKPNANDKKHQTKKNSTTTPSSSSQPPKPNPSSSTPETPKTTATPPPKKTLPEDYYELLGITKSASSIEITKAYRKRCVQTHPDKTSDGDRTEFDLISQAYHVLSDDTQKSMYDRFGKKGLDNNHHDGGGGAAAADMFRSFFGGTTNMRSNHSGFSASFGGGGSSFFREWHQSQTRQTPPQPKVVRYQLEVTLEDLYLGSTRKVTIAKPTSVDAHGRPTHKRQQHKQVEIIIERGMSDRSTIVLPGEADYIPNAPPGDVVFVLSAARHRVFTRRNNDLAVEVEISFKESLNGYTNTIAHLDGRKIVLQTDPKDVIEDGHVRVLKGEGFPIRNRGGGRMGMDPKFGDLYVQFKVRMPSNWKGLSMDEKALLGDLVDVAAAHDTLNVKEAIKKRLTLKKTLEELLRKTTLIDNENENENEVEDNQSQNNDTAVVIDSVSDDIHNATTTSSSSNKKKKRAEVYLEMAKVSDFGTGGDDASYQDNPHDEEDEHYHEGEEEDPFQQFGFFPGASRSSFSRSNSFGNGQDNMQCQQM